MSVSPLIIIGGSESASLPVIDRGLNFGDGVFETMRWCHEHRSLPLWSYHQERLLASCRRLNISLSVTRLQQWLSHYLDLLSKNTAIESDGIVKLLVTRGCGGQGYSPEGASEPNVIFQYRELESSENQRKGVELEVCSTRLPLDSTLAGLKHLNRLNYVLAAAECKGSGKQGLLLDVHDCVIETLHHNLFVVTQTQQLITPDLSLSGVEGVMRRVILEKIAPEKHLGVGIQKITLQNLLAAKEIFLTNGVRGVWPVKALNNKVWDYFSVTEDIQARVDVMLHGAAEVLS